ncbi:MAG: NUDIX domain-containing protein [bacterium]|nr:NUDIX domain-containing protein [bacterium]
MPHIHTEPGQVDHTVEVFVVFSNKVLLRKHDKYGIWLSVGGHIELDEDPNQAALREVKEEVGLDISLYSPTKMPTFEQADYTELIPPIFLNRHRINASHEHVTYTYLAICKNDKIKPEHPDDIWEWFSENDLNSREKEIRASILYYARTALKTLAEK